VLGNRAREPPVGVLADRLPVAPSSWPAARVVTIASVTCALTHSIGVLIGARFVQGLFIPSMTTCLAAYLSRTLPPHG